MITAGGTGTHFLNVFRCNHSFSGFFAKVRAQLYCKSQQLHFSLFVLHVERGNKRLLVMWPFYDLALLRLLGKYI
jgi:hypothetical protein